MALHPQCPYTPSRSRTSKEAESELASHEGLLPLTRWWAQNTEMGGGAPS